MPITHSRTATLSAPSLTSLNNLFAAWRLGKSLCRPGTGPQRKPPDWYMDPSINFTPEEKIVLKQCIFYASKARQMAVQEDIPASCKLFAIARMMSETSTLSCEAMLLCQSEVEAAEAYLDYVCADSNGAKRRLLAAMSADEALEREYGHAEQHIHRIHLANNIVKVEARSGNLAGALTLASCILRYIDDDLATLPLPGEWGGAYRKFMSESASRFLARQTTHEVACAMADPSLISEYRAWTSFQETLGITKPTSLHQGEPDEWYAAKRAFLDSRHEPSVAGVSHYLFRAANFLAQGPRESLALWRLVALDVGFACSDMEGVTTFQLRKEIVDDLTSATSLPRHVRALLPRVNKVSPRALPFDEHSVQPEAPAFAVSR